MKETGREVKEELKEDALMVASLVQLILKLCQLASEFLFGAGLHPLAGLGATQKAKLLRSKAAALAALGATQKAKLPLLKLWLGRAPPRSKLSTL